MDSQLASGAPAQSAFADILRPGINILTATRSLDRGVVDSLQAVARGELFQVSARMDTRRPDASPLLEPVSNQRARQFLARDIAWLAREFGELVQKKHLQVLLSVVRTDSCRKFHTDNVVMRLLCTYAGPGTEWIENADVVRDNLARIDVDTAEANRSVMRREDSVRRCGVGEVILLKGEASPGNRGRGAVHRSPPIEAQGLRRLVLKIDEHACGC